MPKDDDADQNEGHGSAWKDVPDTNEACHTSNQTQDYDMYAALAGNFQDSEVNSNPPIEEDYLDALLTDESAILLACGEVDSAINVSANPHNSRSTTRLSGSKRKRSTMMTGSKVRKGRESLLNVAASPMVSSDVINNRRTSIGIYGVFSKEYLDQL